MDGVENAFVSEPNVPETEVLVIYCGGTIGMKPTSEGLAPAPHYLTRNLAQRPQFHDPTKRPLTTKPTLYGKRIHYVIKEYKNLLDSSEMDMTDWVRIARDIFNNYEQYDAFVILHGTDTMAYTASALSFMLKNLTKTVILTGSTVPLSMPYNDGSDNIFGSLMIAGHFRIPEVCIYFNHKLYRGNRTSKFDSGGFDSFRSHAYPTLVDVGIHFVPDWNSIRAPPFRSKGFSYRDKVCKNVVVLKLFPGILPELIRNMLLPPVQGCVLESYGAGNAPTNPAFLKVLKEATDRGVIIVNVSQCQKGRAEPAYVTGRRLHDVGVIFGADMTTEAALTKLAVLIPIEPDRATLEMRFSRSSRGEVTFKDEGKSKGAHSLATYFFETMDKNGDRSAGRGKDFSSIMNEIERSLGPHLLFEASACGNSLDVAGLLELNADPNVTDYNHRSPLHLACQGGHPETVKILLIAGADVNCVDSFGNTPLDLSSQLEDAKTQAKLEHLLRENGGVSLKAEEALPTFSISNSGEILNTSHGRRVMSTSRRSSTEERKQVEKPTETNTRGENDKSEQCDQHQ